MEWIMTQPKPQPSPIKTKKILRFILAILVMLLVSFSGFAAFKRLGAQDDAAQSLTSLVVYPVFGLVIWLGGFDLLGLDTKQKRGLGVLICCAFFLSPVVNLGMQYFGASPRTAAIFGIGAWLAVMLAIIFGIYRNVRKQ
jgi:hypothetical protein